MNYFDRQARAYLSRSQKGIWRAVRNVEMRAVLSEINPQKGEKILDVGCGAGFYALELRKLGLEVTGIDCSSPMIKQFQSEGFHGLLGKFEEYEFNDLYDKVLIAGATEFMEDSQTICGQLERVLRPGGIAVILAPRKNVYGRLYKLWHQSHGCSVTFHDFEVGIGSFSRLRMESFRNVTPVSKILRLMRT